MTFGFARGIGLYHVGVIDYFEKDVEPIARSSLYLNDRYYYCSPSIIGVYKVNPKNGMCLLSSPLLNNKLIRILPTSHNN